MGVFFGVCPGVFFGNLSVVRAAVPGAAPHGPTRKAAGTGPGPGPGGRRGTRILIAVLAPLRLGVLGDGVFGGTVFPRVGPILMGSEPITQRGKK